MKKGRFVAFEGIEGSGKSTQVALLAARLKERGHDPVLVREPGGTELGEEARRLVLHGAADVSPAGELFLYLLARAELVARVIRPALEAGRVVIADRYELSSRAYQAAGRGLEESKVRSAIALATGGLAPDLYVVLDLGVEAGRKRQLAQGKRPDRIESADQVFHRRVAAAFRKARGRNVVHVSADGPAAQVGEAVWKAFAKRFILR